MRALRKSAAASTAGMEVPQRGSSPDAEEASRQADPITGATATHSVPRSDRSLSAPKAADHSLADNHPQVLAKSPDLTRRQDPSAFLRTYSFRSEVCPDCDRATDIHCDTCWSSGEIVSSCADCGRVAPLNSDGVCEYCDDASELPVAIFHAKWLCPHVKAQPGRVEL